MSYTLKDGSKSTDYKGGDLFRVEGDDDTFSIGSIVKLEFDDETACPKFELVSGDNYSGDGWDFEYWSNLTPVDSKNNGTTKNKELKVPFCVSVSNLSYEEYVKLHNKLVFLGYTEVEGLQEEVRYTTWNYLGVNGNESIIHWDNISDFDNDDIEEEVGIYTLEDVLGGELEEQTKAELPKPQKPRGERNVSRKNTKAVVYYTDGKTYTINGFLGYIKGDDNVVIEYYTDPKTKKVEAGVVIDIDGHNSMVTIDKEHLAGIVIKEENGEDRVIRFHHLFSAKYGVANTKQESEGGVIKLDKEAYEKLMDAVENPAEPSQELKNLMSLDNSVSTEDNEEDEFIGFIICEGDYLRVKDVTESQCKAFVDMAIDINGFDRGEYMSHYYSHIDDWRVSINDGRIFYGSCYGTNDVTKEWLEYCETNSIL